MNKIIFLWGGVLLLLSSSIFPADGAAGGGGAVGRAFEEREMGFKPVDQAESVDDSDSDRD
ncbi:hypothetical protein EBQ93_02970, partial [bacterium]|nr:hypothetical protein [bacterium]